MTLRHIDGTALSADTAQTPGMLREEAISGASVGMRGSRNVGSPTATAGSSRGVDGGVR